MYSTPKAAVLKKPMEAAVIKVRRIAFIIFFLL
jgi:hypothetical protein